MDNIETNYAKKKHYTRPSYGEVEALHSLFLVASANLGKH